jgi:hypothetical protein
MAKTIQRILLLVIATCISCKYEEDSVLPENIIKIEAESNLSNIMANGSTILNFKATIPTDAEDAYKNVTFLVSDTKAGSFTGTNADNVNVKVDQSGIARTSLKVGTMAGTYFVSAQIKNGDKIYKAGQITLVMNPVINSDSLSLSSENKQPPADDLTTFRIQIQQKYSNDKKVKLTCNTGSFISSAVKEITAILDEQGKGSVDFKISNELSSHIITATASNGTTASLRIDPIASYPDSIISESSSSSIDTTGTPVQIKTYLRKFVVNAKASKGTPVFFTAYQMVSGKKISVGRFTGTGQAVSDGAGDVPAVSFYGDTGGILNKQPVIVEASSSSGSVKKIYAVLSFKVK